MDFRCLNQTPVVFCSSFPNVLYGHLIKYSLGNYRFVSSRFYLEVESNIGLEGIDTVPHNFAQKSIKSSLGRYRPIPLVLNYRSNQIWS